MCRDKIDVVYSTADKNVKCITFKTKKWQNDYHKGKS